MKISIKPAFVATLLDSAIINLDAVREFYKTTYGVLNEKESIFLSSNTIGLEIEKKLDSLFDKNDVASRETHIKELLESKISENKKLGDILDIQIPRDDSGKQILSKVTIIIVDENLYKRYDPVEIRNKRLMYNEQHKILSMSVLSSLMVIFESFLSKIYKILILNDPTKFLGEEKISIAKIINSKVNDIIETAVDDEVTNKLYDAISLLNLLKDKCGIVIDRYEKVQKQFEEIYYRRNIYIHNNGIANTTYFSKVQEECRQGSQLNKLVECDESYLNNAIIITKKVICSIYYELLMIINVNDAFDTLFNIGFDELCKENYTIAEHVFKALKSCDKLAFADKLNSNINFIISLKRQGKPISNLVRKIDVSAVTDKYKIAKFCLEDNNQEVYRLLTKTYPKYYSASEIRDWPIFSDFRKTEFYESFKMEHSSDFEEIIFEDTKANDTDSPIESENDDVSDMNNNPGDLISV